ncbi:MAG: hypothetical protein QW385_06890 [Thermoproteota archaeon]
MGRIMDNRGQMRVVEALLASGIIAAAMITMMNLTRTPDPYSTKSRNELTRYCYDFLMNLAEEEVFDKVIFDSNGTRNEWEGLMKNMLNALLPANILYNMTVYNMTWTVYNMTVYNTTWTENVFRPVPLGVNITNVSPYEFRLAEIATGADITYTTRSRWVLKIHLELARRL